MTTKDQKRGLELLIRRPAAEGQSGGFELKTLDRDEAFLRLRPRRSSVMQVEENTLQEAEGKVYVVRFAMHDTERYIRLTQKEYFLLRHMDGAHTILEIATAYVFRFGTLDVDDVRRFLNRARKLHLVELPGAGLHRSRTDDEEPSGRWGRLISRLSWRWNRVDPYFDRLHRVLRPLYSTWTLVPVLLLVLAGLGVYLQGRFAGLLAPSIPTWQWLLVLLCWSPVFIVLHELAHGIACRAFGRRVKAVGFTFLDDLVPSFYVDVTDMLMASRGARIAVSLAGPLANLVMGGGAALLARLLPLGPWSTALVVAADANLLIALYTLWPFHPVREDGYLVLTDIVRVPALRGRALQALLRRRDQMRLPISPRLRALYALYLGGLGLTVVGGLALLASLVL